MSEKRERAREIIVWHLRDVYSKSGVICSDIPDKILNALANECLIDLGEPVPYPPGPYDGGCEWPVLQHLGGRIDCLESTLKDRTATIINLLNKTDALEKKTQDYERRLGNLETKTTIMQESLDFKRDRIEAIQNYVQSKFEGIKKIL